MLTHIEQPFDGLFVRGSSMLERLHVTVIEWSANETRNLIKNSELDKGSIDRGLSFIIKDFACWNGKTTKIRRTAVRETGVSRQNRGQIGGPSETLRTSHHYVIEGTKGLINWATTVPRGSSLSNNQDIFLSGLHRKYFFHLVEFS